MEVDTKNLFRIALIASIATTTAACGTITKWADQIGTQDQDPRHEVIADLPSKIDLVQRWSHDIGSDSDHEARLQPLIARDVIYASDANGSLGMYRVADGEPVWRRNLESQISFALGHSKNLLTLGTSEGQVIAVRTKDGREKWRRDLGTAITAISPRRRDTIVVRTDDYRIVALNALNGRRLWTVKTAPAVLTILGMSTNHSPITNQPPSSDHSPINH